MRAIFADTFYWIALINANDECHEKVLQLSQTLTSSLLVTTDSVVDEMLNFFASRGSFLRVKAYALSKRIQADPSVRLIPHQVTFRQAGLDLYGQRPDKGYSLTDCLSMVVMRQMSLTEVLTRDQHFSQEGFVLLF